MRIYIILMCSKIFKQAMFRSVAAQKDSLNLPVKMKWNDPAIHPAANTKINTSSISAVWSAANPSGWWVSGLVKRPWRLQILAGVIYIYISIDIIYIIYIQLYTYTHSIMYIYYSKLWYVLVISLYMVQAYHGKNGFNWSSCFWTSKHRRTVWFDHKNCFLLNIQECVFAWLSEPRARRPGQNSDLRSAPDFVQVTEPQATCTISINIVQYNKISS